MSSWRVDCGDSLEALRGTKDDQFDAVVTDPPYGLRFMGKRWDYDIPNVELWCEVLRTLKPGGHALIFGGTRTYHRMACAVEDAGFEIRDCIMWVYGTGFPKSLNVSKAIDRKLGAKRKKVRRDDAPAYQRSIGNRRPWMDDPNHKIDGPDPVTHEAQKWEGWGTAIKPAYEPIILARKPFGGTVASNVLQHGTGALNIDGCRVPGEFVSGWSKSGSKAGANVAMSGPNYARPPKPDNPAGRWPANLIHDGSEEVLAEFPDSKRQCGDSGSAARFFYCAKASKKERGAGNRRPTVKPVALMRYLCRLVTPPGGLILDPFCGSGSTGIAALAEGFNFLGIEREEEYSTLAAARIQGAENG